MKYLLIACCLSLAPRVYAQSAPTTTAPVSAPSRYCALVVADDRYFNSSRARLEYGQPAPGEVADPEMAEMAKTIHQSGSIIDICNYLGRHGWEWLSTTTVQTGGRKSSLNDMEYFVENETRYFFRRRTP
ncbi:hypothetical protein E4631_06075 [Hymenobacter sp. UV11]|uniref:hypothetical protein n=1 Tax=Hymenobacter sp. UV11 TaxID=1849735 RepID=UPI00105C293A|nr:hypothetical protein [Hymenobacter sp. UV11]TFZ67544.1 hypothetical protein E4631_06075 [Hymenobacter sp. UV11]